MEQIWKRVNIGPDTFEALSSEERINILKLLDSSRQMTGTDVANALNISKSSAFKQLNRLARAGLVERMDEGRKWIYYRNTSKAERLLPPEDVTITLVLSAAVAALIVGLLLLLTLQPIMVTTPGDGNEAANGPDVLVLGQPTMAGNALIVGVSSGSARLADVEIRLLDASTGAAIAGPATTSMLPQYSSHANSAPRSVTPAVSVLDMNGDGALNAGDEIVVTGLVSGQSASLAVVGESGATLASVGLES